MNFIVHQLVTASVHLHQYFVLLELALVTRHTTRLQSFENLAQSATTKRKSGSTFRTLHGWMENRTASVAKPFYFCARD